MSTARPAERILVLGIGNPILGDDGVGWEVADRVADHVRGRGPEGSRIEVDCVSTGGLALMERLVGYDRAVLVDAILGSGDPPGTIRVRALADVPGREASHLDSPHDVPILVALETGRALGARLPDEITVVSVEVERVDTFSEQFSPAVGAVVPSAATAVERLLAGEV
jgi:hydrogenase maturation protease